MEFAQDNKTFTSTFQDDDILLFIFEIHHQYRYVS